MKDKSHSPTRRSFLGNLAGGVAGLSVWSTIGLSQRAPFIKIGVSLPLTGVFAIAGSKHRDGYLLWQKLVNQRGGVLGRRVEILLSDNRSNTETAVAQYERFINHERVDLLFGTFSSRLTFPTSAIAEQNRMVCPVPSGGALSIWERGFKHLFYFQQNVAEFIGRSPVEAVVDHRALGQMRRQDFPLTAVEMLN